MTKNYLQDSLKDPNNENIGNIVDKLNLSPRFIFLTKGVGNPF